MRYWLVFNRYFSDSFVMLKTFCVIMWQPNVAVWMLFGQQNATLVEMFLVSHAGTNLKGDTTQIFWRPISPRSWRLYASVFCLSCLVIVHASSLSLADTRLADVTWDTSWRGLHEDFLTKSINCSYYSSSSTFLTQSIFAKYMILCTMSTFIYFDSNLSKLK